MDHTKAFSLNLVKTRKEMGLSQKELAQITGISPRMIAHYEKHVSHPSLEKIQKIAETLGIPIGRLLGLSDGDESNQAFDLLSNVNIKTLKQFKRILRLNPHDRSTIYQMVDGLLQKAEYKAS